MCPECIFITKEQNIFEKHAVDNHPLSHVLFGISNDNLYDFIEETETNSEFFQDIYGTTLNTKSNFEAHLAKDSSDISDEIIENAKKLKDAQVQEEIKFNPCNIKEEDSEEISNENFENSKKWKDAQVHKEIKFNPCNIRIEDSEEISNAIIENSSKKSKNTLLCPICGKHFCNQTSKKVHIETIHEGKKPFRCDTCGVNFSQKGTLNDHILRIHEKINKRLSLKRYLYTCIDCDYECDSNSELKKHRWTVHKGKKLFSCLLCDATYTTQTSLAAHTSTVHEGKRFSCKICNSTFTQKHSLNEHIKYTHERKERPSRDVVLKCNDCVFEFDSQEKLNTHVRKVHEEVKCNVCNVRLPKAELNLHVITEHKGKNSKCSICSATFVKENVLRHHLRTVHEEKKFKCHICDKMFTTRNSLNYHKENVCKGKKRTEK